jgi:hypothetical protein
MEGRMAYVISLTKVQQILEGEVDKINIRPFADTAKQLIDQHLLGEGIADSLLSEIGCWLAAHFYTASRRRPGEIEIGDVREKYYSKIGQGLEQTEFGQQAMILDPTAKLSKMNEKRTLISIEVI